MHDETGGAMMVLEIEATNTGEGRDPMQPEADERAGSPLLSRRAYLYSFTAFLQVAGRPPAKGAHDAGPQSDYLR